ARSLARPGGNTTGVSILAPELNGKRQDFLIEAVPGARRMAVLADSHVTAPRELHVLQAAMRSRDIELLVFEVTRVEEILPALEKAHAGGAAAVNLLASPLLFAHRRSIMDPAAAVRLPANVSMARNCGRGRLHELRSASHANVSSDGAVGRQGLARRQARRSSHRTADEVRAGHQSQDR